MQSFVRIPGAYGRDSTNVKLMKPELNFVSCRHVVLPKELVRLVPKSHLMTENEWRAIGVQQSRGWVHYMIHQPEPHILLFRRPKTAGN